MLLPDKKDSVLQWKHLQLVSELMDGLHKVNTVWKRLKQTRAGGAGAGGVGEILSVLKARAFAALARPGLCVEITHGLSFSGRLVYMFAPNQVYGVMEMFECPPWELIRPHSYQNTKRDV